MKSWLKDPYFLAAIKEAEEKNNTDYLSPIQLRAINLVSNELKKNINLYRIARMLKISYKTLISWLEDEVIKKLVIKAAQDKNIPLEKTPFSLLIRQKRKYGEILDETNTYSKKQVMELLSINSENEFYKIIQHHPIPFIYYNGAYKFYIKAEVENLVAIQKQLLSDYVTVEQVQDMLSGTELNFRSQSMKDGIEETSPAIVALIRPIHKRVSKLYKKDDVLAWKNKQLLKISANTISLDNSYETFLYRLEIKEKMDDTLYLNNFGPFTKESWLAYVRNKLKNSTANQETLNKMIGTFIHCTSELNEFLGSKKSHEIYSFNSNEINMLFNGIGKTHAESIYLYLKNISDKYEEVRKRAYKIDNITNPFEIPPTKKHSKEIYDYKTFKDVMKFCNNISFQKERAISDIIEEINKKKKKYKYYGSSWLYMLMHLNNAWRNSDVITFPRISLEGTSIVDLEWLKENDIPPTDADIIVNQIQRKDLTISKTQVKNHFFISDELKLAFATAAAICELRVQKLNPLRTNLIDFGTKTNVLTPSKSKNFLKELDNEEFVFGSKKMNRTLMSYVYSILSKMKGSDYALKVVQNMRGHVDEETTLIYVDLTQEAVDDLTKQLFDRGAFGFIYDTFIDFINGVELNRHKRTLEIQSLKNNFGSLENVEHLSGFINSIQQERQAIMDTIYSLGLEEARLYVNKIHANVMLGKDKATQCLVYKSKGCLKPHLPCLNCVYSIPNYYTLSVLADSLERRIEGYLIMLSSEEANYNEQRKYIRLLYTELESFFEAKGKFDEEVYTFLSISKEDFIEKLTNLPANKENFNLE
ncbi:hypothetical protein HXV90_09190 [Lysinibacillus sp. JK80]|uniref:hypothetical protein n=1 Tax=Lysinibacillus sp. JK80 TaxID=2749809 RepID=UPI0022B97859|nr:hypothetical protein [Lysinibacillus sp. JK80]WBF56019.1 hypothetical protein HXV90_09190 [Lysinibacillus sp. JK80]